MRSAWLPTVLALALFAQGCVSFHAGALPGEPSDATFAQIEDTRVHYIDTGGEKPPVVLIHGFSSSTHVWRNVIPALENHHRVIALDLKGFGWTDRAPGDYSPEAQAQMLAGLLDKLGVQSTALVAHSWGSSVALAFALQHPQKVTRIALYDAWVYAEQLPSFFYWARTPVLGEALMELFYSERLDEKMESAFYNLDFVTENVLDAVREDIARPGTRAAALEAIRGQHYDLVQHRYREIQQPVLLLWGREDRITTLVMGETLSRDLPHAELVVYPRCGHFPMYEAANASTQKLQHFLGLDLYPNEERKP